ncbi:MAG: RraA family protein [Balneolaceae bacterium]
MFETDSEIFVFMKENLFVAVVCDMLDSLGYRNQAMHRRLRPLLPDREQCGFIGRSRTVQWMETEYVDEEDPYGLEIEMMDSLKPGDIVVHSTDYSGNNVPWGELLTTVAVKNGAAGCVCDSNIRDCTRIIEMNFPVYYTGILPLDSMGRARVMDYDVPIRCGGVQVQSGELIFADYDGIVVIPESVEREVLKLSLEKVGKESVTRKELQAGKTLREVYDRYGIL